MRQVYVDVMTEFSAKGMAGSEGALSEKAGEAGRRKYWEEKILGLGSPKVDKVLNTRKEDLEIPGGMDLRVIESRTGAGRRSSFTTPA